MSSRDGHGTARLPASFAQVTAELIPADGKFHSCNKNPEDVIFLEDLEIKNDQNGFNYFHLWQGLCPESTNNKIWWRTTTLTMCVVKIVVVCL